MAVPFGQENMFARFVMTSAQMGESAISPHHVVEIGASADCTVQPLRRRYQCIHHPSKSLSCIAIGEAHVLGWIQAKPLNSCLRSTGHKANVHFKGGDNLVKQVAIGVGES